MPEQPLRLGIVGCGQISHTHAQAAAAIPRKIKFVACCDKQESAAKEWAGKYRADAFYTDYLQMVSQQRLDAVLLATWPVDHRAQIDALLEAGVKNILCEKALTLTGHEAVQIAGHVRKRSAFLMEGFMYRHHPVIKQIDAVLASGKLGAIDTLRAAFCAELASNLPAGDPRLNWRSRKECGGGVPYDFTCYCVNAVNHFAGEPPIRVQAFGSLHPLHGTIDRLGGMIRYASGNTAYVESSHYAAQNQETQINGAKMGLYLPFTWVIGAPTQLEFRKPQQWGARTVAAEPVAMANAYQLQLENFAAVVRGQARPTMPLRESVVNTFTIEALVRSFNEARPVDIELPGELDRI